MHLVLSFECILAILGAPENRFCLVSSYEKPTVQVVNFVNVETLQEAQTRQWTFLENLKNAVISPAVIYSNEQLLVVGHTANSTTCQDVQYLNLATNTTGVYADTIDCGMYNGYHFPGMYNIIGGDVSIFAGASASESCMQQSTSGKDLNSKWECVSSSESALEGFDFSVEGSGYSSGGSGDDDVDDWYGRAGNLISFSNFVL